MPLLITVTVFLAISNINLSKDYRNGSMEADGKGYYAYLPAIFIYHDLSFSFFYQIERQTYYNPNFYYSYLRTHEGNVINKYYAGTALCMLPFFALGHLTTLAVGLPPDGYSYYCMVWIHLGALFYLFIGLLLLRKLLTGFGIAEKWTALVLVFIVFGTNLFYYVVTEYSMSHMYSFAAVTAFLHCMFRYFRNGKDCYLPLSGLLLGLIALIRPVNLVIVFCLPFIAGSFTNLLSGLRRMLLSFRFYAGVLLFLLIASIQPLIYYIQTGSLFVYSYPGEGFNFREFHFIDVLFSYRKGLFVYTPLLLLSLTGFYYLGRKNRQASISLGMFLILITYLFSSWHMWYYGGSFSQRVFIEYYALFAILLGTALQESTVRMRNAVLSVAVVLTLFCQYQTYQYRHMVIHWSDMTKERYWDGFFRLNPEPSDQELQNR